MKMKTRSQFNLEQLKSKFKYAEEIKYISDQYYRNSGFSADGYIPSICSILEDMSEETVKEALGIFLKKHKGKHPNYFKGIAKQIDQKKNRDFGEII